MTSRNWMKAQALGLRALFMLGLASWVAVIVLAHHYRDQPRSRPSDSDPFVNVIFSGH